MTVRVCWQCKGRTYVRCRARKGGPVVGAAIKQDCRFCKGTSVVTPTRYTEYRRRQQRLFESEARALTEISTRRVMSAMGMEA